MPLEGIHVDDKLQFVEEPVEIMEREIKRLKRSRIPLVKVRWNSRRGPEFTWELIISSPTSAVTYTSVYTDSEPGRAFWGADDEEVSEGGILRVIVLGYDGLPLQDDALMVRMMMRDEMRRMRMRRMRTRSRRMLDGSRNITPPSTNHDYWAKGLPDRTPDPIIPLTEQRNSDPTQALIDALQPAIPSRTTTTHLNTYHQPVDFRYDIPESE
ncbi:hypothetical protein Tco_0190842 [Tanacetum coccineum]